MLGLLKTGYRYLIARLDSEMVPALVAQAGPGFQQELGAMPLANLHTKSSLSSEMVRPANETYHWMFSALVLLILGIAMMNYVNMSTARSFERVKEIGIRTAMGARQSQLWLQFIGEALILCLISSLCSVPVAYIGLGILEQISGISLDVNILAQGKIWLIAVGLGLVTALLAGGYPAMVLSRVRPVASSHKMVLGGGGALFRKALVVTQFFIVTLLMYGVTVVYQHLQHIKNADLGYDKSHVVFLPLGQIGQTS